MKTNLSEFMVSASRKFFGGFMDGEKLPAALARKFAAIEENSELDEPAKSKLKRLERTAYRARIQAQKIRKAPAAAKRKEVTWGQQMVGIMAMARAPKNAQEWGSIKGMMARFFETPEARERWDRFVETMEADWAKARPTPSSAFGDDL